MVVRKARKTKYIAYRCWSLATVALAVGCLTPTLRDVNAQGPREGEPPPVPVVAGRVTKQPKNISRTFVGSIKPLRSSIVSSSVAELVEAFLVDEGQYVEKDAPLAQLRTRQLVIQSEAAAAELELLNSEWEELKNGSREEEIEQAKSRMDASQALKTYATQAFERARVLQEQNALSNEEMEDLLSARQAAEARHQENVAAWDLVTAGPREEKKAQAAARVRIQENVVAQLDDSIQQHTICAPFAGFIVKERTEEGQWLDKGGAVVEMVEIKEVDVETPILESYIRNLRVGMQGTVEVEAYPGELLKGTVAHIVPVADTQARSFPVKVRIRNRQIEDVGAPTAPLNVSPESLRQVGAVPPQMMLMPGMFARVHLSIGPMQDVLLVPKDALVLKRREKFVFVVDLSEDAPMSGERVARREPVDVGLSYEELIEVHGDLRPDEIVVVEGNERLRNGQPVRIIKFATLADTERREEPPGNGNAATVQAPPATPPPR